MHLRAHAFLFDLDGTLINSIAAVNRVWGAWGQRHGIPWETLKNVIHGRRALDTMQALAPHLAQPEEADRLTAAEIADTEGVVPIPGAIAFLHHLPPERWAIVTSCTPALAAARMRAAGIPEPRVLITAADIIHGKPAPDGFLLAAERLGFRPEDCLVFEDAQAGIEAGQRAGMQVLAITATHEHAKVQISSMPDYSQTSVQIFDDGLTLYVSGDRR
ncbi:MAG TPA: HAD-IA family hydrolase [Oligoflexus sp.]|uniref:HAD-IA family hydrolase n=1 Tax=Oligoflexus sp. TaxID=1971216 RepID=UPI002D257C65|nr:HAD-IA family hydrolase [Oligoflexus sp.]HYX36246.1 HAD-IA family hydrolase [Oligoflexus sp.]